MSEADTAAPIDLTAEVAVPEGEVSREQLVKILEDSRKSEPQEEAAVSAEPAKPEPKPETEKVSARIIASRRAEMRAKEERQAIAAERHAIEAARAEVAEAKAQADALKAAKLSPSKALELLGMSPKEFLETLATEDEPEAHAKRASAGMQTELQKIQAELQALKDERANEVRRARHAEAQQATQVEGDAFVEHVAEHAEKYPALVEAWTPAEFVREGFACLEEVIGRTHAGKPITRLEAFMAEQGHPPSNEDIAEFLEHRAQPAFKARSAWRERIGKSAPIPSQGASANQGQPVTAAKPRTLTNGASSTNASAPKPWSQRDADEESKRIFEAMYASRQDS